LFGVHVVEFVVDDVVVVAPAAVFFGDDDLDLDDDAVVVTGALPLPVVLVLPLVAFVEPPAFAD
jgi:hypothetical protein